MGVEFLDKYAVDGRHYDQKVEIDKALNDKDWGVRETIMQHPNISKAQIDKALDDIHWFVRHAAIKHPNATMEHIDKALGDEHWAVSSEASDIAKRNGWL